MMGMAENYKGPHKVVARQTKSNIGTLGHVLDVATMAGGQLIVLAAGDDVSKANRSTRLTEVWQETGAWGLYSDFSEIDENGVCLKEHDVQELMESPTYRLRQYLIHDDDKPVIIHGATSAYDKRLFGYVNLPSDTYILSEDGALSVLLHILRKHACRLPEPLVDYRVHEGALTNTSRSQKRSWRTIVSDEEKIKNWARSQANRCQFLIESHDTYNKEPSCRVDLKKVSSDLENHKAVSEWWDTGLFSKVSYLRAHTKSEIFIWGLPRILPKKIFLSIKYLHNRFLIS
jgi:hypothetical protein